MDAPPNILWEAYVILIAIPCIALFGLCLYDVWAKYGCINRDTRDDTTEMSTFHAIEFT